MLKPSKKSGGSPLINEGKSHGPSSHPKQPNLPGSMKNRVLVDEVKGNGKKSTFTSPRSDAGGGDATTCGYTKVG